jgi:hypothetical protein
MGYNPGGHMNFAPGAACSRLQVDEEGVLGNGEGFGREDGHGEPPLPWGGGVLGLWPGCGGTSGPSTSSG